MSGVAVVIALFTAGSGPAAGLPQGLDGSLCATDSSRATIPGDFPLRACFDGSDLFVANDTDFVLRLVTDPGRTGIATPMPGADVPGSIVSMLPQDLNLIPPNFMIKVPVGDGRTAVKLLSGGEDVNKAWVVMKLVLEYTPVGSASTLYSLAQELVDVTESLSTCLEQSGWVGDIGCRTGYAGNAAFAFGRASLSLTKGSLGALMGVVGLAQWSDTAAGQLLDLRAGTTEFVIEGAPAVAPSSSPSSPSSSPSSSSPSPSSSAPPTSSTGSQNPTFTGGYVIEDSFFGGTWPRVDPNDGTWYSKSNRPANAATYWWANGLGVGFSCAAHAATYTVRFGDGHTETWDTWLRSTDTWGGRVVGLWVPSAVADKIFVDGIPPGMPTCSSTTSSAPPTSSTGSQNPTFTGGYVVEDSFFGGTWPRVDPNDGTWYSKSNRPANAATYWWANGLGVGFSCAAHAATYTVRFGDGHTETWDTWLRSTDTWGGRVVGLWVPSAVADKIFVDGIPPGMPTC